MNETLTTPIQSDLRVILIEETEYWNQDIKDACGTISCAYLYDNAVNTFCCELTPSKELHPLYYVTENEISDEVWEQMQDTFNTTEEIRYMKLLPEADRNEVKQSNFDFTDARSQEYKEEFEEMEESCKCNHDF